MTQITDLINKIRGKFILLILLFSSPHLFSQSASIDSLTKALKTAPESPEKVKLLNELALEFEYDDTTKAVNYVLEANRLALKINDQKGLAKSFTTMGFFDEDKGNYEKARGYYLKSLHTSESIDDKKAMAGSCNNIATMYSYQGNNTTALEYYNRALQTFISTNDTQGMAKVFGNIGMVYESYGNNQKAIETHQKAAGLFEQLMKKNPGDVANKKGMANAFNNIGNTYKILGNYSIALNYHLKALKIREEIGDKVGMADSYGNIGTIYTTQKNDSLALEAYRKDLQICQSIGDKQGLGDCNNYLGCIYYTEKKYDLAMNYFIKAKSFLEDIGDRNGIARIDGNIGIIYEEKKDFPNALNYLLKALQLQEELNDKSTMLISLNHLGLVNLYQNKNKEAIRFLERSIKIGKEIGAKEELSNSYQYIAKAYSGLNDFSKAYEYEQQFSALKDTLLSKESSKQIAEMQTKYGTEKKEKEIQLLNKDKALQSSEITRQKNFRNSLFAVLGLIFILGLVLLKAYQTKRKSNDLLSKQKQEINIQKEMLEHKNKDITDSINYAKRIQKAIITSDNYLKQHLPEHFVFYKPKDIVSGDFYWCVQTSDHVIMATADCTGHGVPGAFMSVIGASLLNEIIIERKITRPDLVLNHLREGVIKSLNQEGSDEEGRDGMDIVLCKFDFKNMNLEFAAANNPVWILSEKGEFTELKPDKFPVGKQSDNNQPFTLQSRQLQKGDTVYTFTDGYADQFGGAKGKKFRYKQLKEVFINNLDKPLALQKDILDGALASWQGDLEQIDDILVVGIKI